VIDFSLRITRKNQHFAAGIGLRAFYGLSGQCLSWLAIQVEKIMGFLFELSWARW